MPYMIMLILGDPADLDDVLEAWAELDVSNVTFIDSMCSQEGVCRPRPRIPIRFAFENLGTATERCSCTLFAVAGSEETVRACIDTVEAIIGDLDDVPGSAVVAWPLSITKGILGSSQYGVSA